MIMTNRVKWGVIGSGGIARRGTIPEGIVPAAHAKLAAVYDIYPEVNSAVVQEYNAHTANSIQELIDFHLSKFCKPQ
jgi:predicted dehydrogenase